MNMIKTYCMKNKASRELSIAPEWPAASAVATYDMPSHCEVASWGSQRPVQAGGGGGLLLWRILMTLRLQLIKSVFSFPQSWRISHTHTHTSRLQSG